MSSHTPNRTTQTFIANLKDEGDLRAVRKLIAQADVLLQSTPLGTIEHFGLGYVEAQQLNPSIIYASISGYEMLDSWRDKVSEERVAQGLSRLVLLGDNADHEWPSFDLTATDMLTGAYLTQNILACLVRCALTGQGGQIKVNLMEAATQMMLPHSIRIDGGILPSGVDTPMLDESTMTLTQEFGLDL